jgi:hypothetical protein
MFPKYNNSTLHGIDMAVQVAEHTDRLNLV